MQNSPSQKKILKLVFFNMFLDKLGYGIIIPILPTLFVSHSILRISPITWTNSECLILIGWLMATFPLLQFISTPILGQISDKYGRRKVLLISICGTITSYLIFALGIIHKNIMLLFIARALDGLSGGNVSTTQAIIGDISDTISRAKNFGFIGVCQGIGLILGPCIGGVLSNPNLVNWFNATTPFIFVALVSGINFILILMFLPETLQVANNNKPITILNQFASILKVFLIPDLSIIFITMFLFNAGFGFFLTFFGAVLTIKFEFTQTLVGVFFSYYGVMIFAAQWLVVRKLSGKVSDDKVLRYAIIFTGICIIMFYLVPSNHSALLYCTPPLLAVSFLLTRAFSTALMVNTSSGEIHGKVLGINASLLALSQSIPVVIIAYLSSSYTTLPILIGGLFIIISGCFFICKFKPKFV